MEPKDLDPKDAEKILSADFQTLCYIIANLPGPTLWLDQTDEDARDYSEARLQKLFDQCAPVERLMPTDNKQGADQLAEARTRIADLERDQQAQADLLSESSGQVESLQGEVELLSAEVETLKAERDTDKEEAEAEILRAYLPSGLSQEELEQAVTDAIAEVGATTRRDMGNVMKVVMGKYRGRVDGKAVQSLVISRLP